MSRTKIGRNSQCPCGTGRKYKHCCWEKVDWNALFADPSDGFLRHLSLRGKNMVFLEAIGDALQLNNVAKPYDWSTIKRACTPAAVVKIHEALCAIWPSAGDLKRVLVQQRESTSAHYLGWHEPKHILKGVMRHALYAESILLVDPFQDPRIIVEEFNPLVHPEMAMGQTVQGLWFWLALAPWIDAGIIKLIRTPGDFDTDLLRRCWSIEDSRFTGSTELTSLREQYVADNLKGAAIEEFKEYAMLAHSDRELERRMREGPNPRTDAEVTSLMEWIRKRREEHPFFVPSLDGGGRVQPGLLTFGVGSCYEMAKLTANITQSHLVTDMSVRWREIEIDRTENGVSPGLWEPFAKAFNDVPFRFLNNVPLPAALELRREGRLENLRLFLQRVWHDSVSGEPMAAANVEVLTAELRHHMQEASEEWKRVDRDLLKWFGADMIAGLVAAGPMIANGGAHWLGASLAAAGIAQLGYARGERESSRVRFPAGFFVELERAAAKD